MTSSEVSVKDAARRLGFDAVGITTSLPAGNTPYVAAWLDAGMQGEMGYLERRAALRAGPLHAPDLLPGAQSVLVVALAYDFPDTFDASSPRPRGVVARYARGTDYHLIFWEKLNLLGGFIAQTWPGTVSRGFADSGPLRERDLAARAGLGWQGKHTGLISLDLGNWFLLGALLTTLPLAPDPPFTDNHCGTCTRCLSACPTGAIVAPQTLDARRCISYLTIELRGPIPLDLRPLIGDRIFGCDDCLAACPWNREAHRGQEARLAARDTDAARPDLLALLALCADNQAFKAKFTGTPLLRTGREGLRRNVCVALGNVGGADAVAALSDVAQTDPSDMVREHARWAMGQIAARVAG